ncbi:F-box/LRR-repeat protein 12-like [Papaver somniferum]|uniref:F-box/LRR-repeat protein 12-like n=1 Tax=Papaver somniferum TaxID=3469 RepID=UPI000E6F531C|nr:F-box/LRR-repeat protein 12-like [Papaver somniferum]
MTSTNKSQYSDIHLASTEINDKGLETLGNCCPSIKRVNLSRCHSITDSGITFLCRELDSLWIGSCSKITGIGFLECPNTLTRLGAGGCELTPEGVKAIVSDGGLTILHLSPDDFGKGWVNTESVMTISKGCSSLECFNLSNCKKVGRGGWEAIGQHCKNLKILHVSGCRKLCDLGLQALRNGCNKLDKLIVDDDNSCSSFALKLFKREKPGVMCSSDEYLLETWRMIIK